tara:strand:+ start:62 stop:211 length:150 start_codon:yes stop_codon:yes gene_type:complete
MFGNVYKDEKVLIENYRSSKVSWLVLWIKKLEANSCRISKNFFSKDILY